MRFSLSTLVAGAIVAGCLATGANAGVITFDEFPADNVLDSNNPIDPNRYAYLGVHIITTDEGETWDGLSDGDPGGWHIEGSNGDNFSGYNGRGYGGSILFDYPIFNFSLDVAGASWWPYFTLNGYANGALVATTTIATNERSWLTASISGTFDTVTYFSTSFLPGHGRMFVIDNIQWGEPSGGVPEPSTWAVMLAGLALVGTGLRRRKAALV